MAHLKPAEEDAAIQEALCKDMLPFTHDIGCHFALARTVIRFWMADGHIEGCPTAGCVILALSLSHKSRLS